MRNKIQTQDAQFHKRKILSFLGVFVAIFSLGGSQIIWAAGDTVPIPFSFDFGIKAAENGADVVNSLQILFILTLIAMAPSLFLMVTSFTRVLVVLHFTRTALGTQQAPPNQVLIGLALFITLFIIILIYPFYYSITFITLFPYKPSISHSTTCMCYKIALFCTIQS